MERGGSTIATLGARYRPEPWCRTLFALRHDRQGASMCTVVIVPLEGGGYLLGHNRDERRSRSRGTPPDRALIEGLRVLAPGDPDGGGTWIGVNEIGLAACLLNAAEAGPRTFPEPPPSRGLLVREALGCRSLAEAVERFSRREGDWARRRAFDLVLASRGDAGALAEIARLAWDGSRARWDRPALPALFTSSTSIGPAVEVVRRAAWSRWLTTVADPASSLAEWLAGHEPERGPYSVCMHRSEARTVSRTLVSVRSRSIVLDYLDGPPCRTGSARTLVAI